MSRLDSGADVTVSNELCYGLAYFWPPVVTGDEFIGGSMARVACGRAIMAGL